jgi:hypothetical protein
MFLMALIPRKFIKIASKTVENYANFWWNKGELFLPFGVHSAIQVHPVVVVIIDEATQVLEAVPFCRQAVVWEIEIT